MKLNIESLCDLEDKGLVVYEVGYRGGNYGLCVNDFIDKFMPKGLENVDDIVDMLPNNVGVYCNYLGGGLRGAIVGGGYSEKLPKKLAKIVDNFVKLCRQRYMEMEDGLNDEVDAEGDTNWDAIGTNASRKAGIVSAY